MPEKITTGRYRPHEVGDPSAGEWAAWNASTIVYEIAHDEQLSGDKAEYRLWLIQSELEKLRDASQDELRATQRELPGLRGWIARRLELGPPREGRGQ